MSHRENSFFSNGQPSQAYSQGEVRGQGSRSDPEGLSLTANRDLAMAEEGAAGEKLRSPTFKPNLCPIKWWRYIGNVFDPTQLEKGWTERGKIAARTVARKELAQKLADNFAKRKELLDNPSEEMKTDFTKNIRAGLRGDLGIS